MTKKKKPEDLLPRGAPSKYTSEVVTRMLQYFTSGAQFPTIEGFCTSEGIVIQTLHNWKDKHPELLDAYHKCMAFQKHTLINGALSRKFDSGFAKFFAINNCGMVSEKQEIKVNTHEEALDALE